MSEKCAGIIYRVVNLTNGKVYFGQTTGSLRKRWAKHVYRSKMESATEPLYRAIRKYGIDRFSVECVCCSVSLQNLDHLERYFIEREKTLSPGGYNLSSGGSKLHRHSKATLVKMSLAKLGKKCSESHRRNISLSKSGRNHPLFGKKRDLETVLKVRRALTGKKASQATRDRISKNNARYWLGKRLSELTRKRMSESARRRKRSNKEIERFRQLGLLRSGIKLSQQHKTKISEGLRRLGNNHPFYGRRLPDGCGIPKRPVYCVELNRVFESITEAAKFINVSPSRISACVNGKQRSSKGYTWREHFGAQRYGE